MKWMRVRFKERNVADPRPVKFPPPGPYWISGSAGDGSYVTIITYLPEKTWKANLLEFWPNVRQTEIDTPELFDEIVFSERFPEPDWWVHRTTIRSVQNHQTSVITVRMTAEEHKLLKTEAHKANLSLNLFVKQAAVNFARSLRADSLEKEDAQQTTANS